MKPRIDTPNKETKRICSQARVRRHNHCASERTSDVGATGTSHELRPVQHLTPQRPRDVCRCVRTGRRPEWAAADSESVRHHRPSRASEPNALSNPTIERMGPTVLHRTRCHAGSEDPAAIGSSGGCGDSAMGARCFAPTDGGRYVPRLGAGILRGRHWWRRTCVRALRLPQ